MLKYLVACGFMLGICLFLIITLIGGMENRLPQIFQLIIAVVTLICLLTALGTSYFAFQRVVRGDAETTVLYPAWDKATATWNSLSYCSRDDVVFDPQNENLISNEELLNIRTSATRELQHTVQQQAHAHSAVASH